MIVCSIDDDLQVMLKSDIILNYSGVTQNRHHWLLLYDIIIAGKQVIYQNQSFKDCTIVVSS